MDKMEPSAATSHVVSEAPAEVRKPAAPADRTAEALASAANAQATTDGAGAATTPETAPSAAVRAASFKDASKRLEKAKDRHGGHRRAVSNELRNGARSEGL